MTDAKAQLVRSWLTKAQHDLASAHVLAANAAEGLYTFVVSLLPPEMRPE